MLKASCKQSDSQVLLLAQVCSSYFPLISSPEHLYVYEKISSQLRWQNDDENDQWMEILPRFTAVKDLYPSREIASRIAPALQDLVGERVTVFHALPNFFLEEPYPPALAQDAIGQFVAARQLPGHPITVSPWDRKEDKWWDEWWVFY